MPHSAWARRRVAPGSAATYRSTTSTAATRRDSRGAFRARFASVPVDYTYRMRIEHRPGQLARAMEAIADVGGLVGEVRTCQLTRSFSVRELTVEVDDDGAADELRDRLDAIDSAEVVGHHDRTLAL